MPTRGILVALQRVDSALRLNVHLHVLGLDGCYVRAEPGEASSELVFHSLLTTLAGCRGCSRLRSM